MTYSILGIDPAAGQIGAAVQSHFFAVGSSTLRARAGVGVVATQSVVEPGYGPRGLDLLARGVPPGRALAELLADDPRAAARQVAVLAVDGAGATHTGRDCIGFAGDAVSRHSRAQANLVASPAVPPTMTDAFERAAGSVAERLVAALRAAEECGGDLRGQQAAALLVVRTTSTGRAVEDVVVDLRVDDAARPLDELERLLVRSRALHTLVDLLETEGLLVGEPTASQESVAEALAELYRAEAILGPGNGEPAVWMGLLLARVGRAEEARACFTRARASVPRIDALLDRLAAAGMWTREPAELRTLLAG